MSLDITRLNFSVSAVCSGLCVQVLQQSQLHKFHFDFFWLCGLQFCECASFTAVRKFHCRVAHLSSLRACFVITVKKYQIYVQKCSFSLKNPIAVVKNSLNQVLLCVSFANFCASSWEKANGSLWPPPHLNAMAYWIMLLLLPILTFTSLNQFWFPVKATCFFMVQKRWYVQ